MSPSVPGMPSLPRSPFGRRGRPTAEAAPERTEPRVEIVESPGLRWINIERPRSLEQTWLEENFEFHALDYEDVRSRNQRPKVDEYDDYTFIVDGPILHETRGVAEWRFRVGAATEVPIRPGLVADGRAWVEHVEHLGFVVGERRENVGLIASLVWTP